VYSEKIEGLGEEEITNLGAKEGRNIS